MPHNTDRLPNPYRPEADVVQARMAEISHLLDDWPAVQAIAQPWVAAVRADPPPFWAMESLLREYPISSSEGLALMRLAEALLRVPDTPTAIAFTADQLGRGGFDASPDGQGLMANLSRQAIALGKRFLPDDGDQGREPGLVARLGAQTVVAATVRAVQLLGRQFVLGETIGAALDEASAARRKHAHLAFSFDMLGEGARTMHDADRYFASYQHAIENIAAHAQNTWALRASSSETPIRDGISIKLSALHPRYEWSQHARVLRELVPRVWRLCERAAAADMQLTIDAEEVDRLELSLDVFEALAEQIAAHFPKWQGFGLAMQAYQTRAAELIDEVARIAAKHSLVFTCRLVKGAYWDTEIKRAQELGLAHYPVFTEKPHTDVSYLACARRMLAARGRIRPQFATHNAGTIAAIARLAAAAGDAPYELQRLHGMGEGVYREAMRARPDVPLRIYAPVGAHRDLLAYLVRRLLENGANSSFVHQLADESVGLDELLRSPAEAMQGGADRVPLPLPPSLYADRANSVGLDIAVASMRAPLTAEISACTVPPVDEFDTTAAKSPVKTALECYRKWSNTSVTERAAAMRRAADALQSDLPRFAALLVVEAKKTLGDAVGEVREAIDFLRYYAVEAERVMAPVSLQGPTGETNVLTLRARGVWVCISPWNFPLAIFTGQVAAALVTGNTVVAKPAEQTPAVAWEMVRLLHAAGVPENALQFAHGPGETVGAALVAHPKIAGVVFTGSTAVARHVNRALAAKIEAPITPLIAETGGINAMIVDSTALPEQVCDAVIQSAFRSAGQRCSALRVLALHEAVADKVLELVRGAASELVVGDARDPATDVGPVIDGEAHRHLMARVKALGALKTPNFESNVEIAQDQWTSDAMNTVAPTVIEVPGFDALAKDEIFGPVLQVVRWAGEVDALVDRIDALGYGLTLGIQTRIDSRAARIAERAAVGNVYVNRNMIGAVVGVQPFGGQGLSGTGPKAGGPHYLPRFCTEQTVTINTAAAGGNAALLAGAGASEKR